MTALGIFTPFEAPSDVINEAQALDVHVMRAETTVGTVRDTVRAYQAAAFDLVVHVWAKSPPPHTSPEIAQYKTDLGKTLDGFHPKLIAIENEENSTRFYDGTVPDYLAELNAAIEVAHGRGVPVTNGGITFKPLALLTWQDYRDRGLQAQADDFAGRVFDGQVLADLLHKPYQGLHSTELQAAWDRAKVLVSAYREMALDYVNFHWYGDDGPALKESVAYLRRATAKPVVTTEIGQYPADATQVSTDLKVAVDDLRLPFVIWFDHDGIPAHGLHEPPAQLRANGQVFARFAGTRAACIS